MKNIKYLLVVFFAVGLIFPSFTSAVTLEELQAQINALMAQIKSLQQQLTTAQQGTTQQWCHDFNVNLKIGDRGKEIEALHAALEKESLSPFLQGPEVSVGEVLTFTEETASAVTGFQQKYASEVLTPLGLKYGTGFVGKATRAKLNKLYGCGSISVPPTTPVGLTIYSPTAGTVFQPDNRLIKISGVVNGNGWVGFEGYAGRVTLIDANGTEINNAFLFTISDWTKMPVYFNAELNASGIKADTGWLVFKNENPSGLAVNAREYRMPVSFKFIGSSLTPSITVLSPNGGETWTVGSTQTIKWNFQWSSQMNIDPLAGISLRVFDKFSGEQLPYSFFIAHVPMEKASALKSYSYSWTIPSVLSNSVASENFQNPSHVYKISIEATTHVFQQGTPDYVSDTSDAAFSIVAGGVGLENMENQLASIAHAVSQLIEQIKKLIAK